MKKLILRCCFASGMAMFLLTSCTKDIGNPAEENLMKNDDGVSLASNGGGNGNVTVSGGGTALEGDAKSTFTFNAVKKMDGSVTGKLIYHIRTSGISVFMDIDCLTVVGNKARMSGMATKVFGKETPPDWLAEGVSTTFTVVDNGEGKSAPPDLFSDLFFALNGGIFDCLNVNFPVAYIPISGNISIK